MIAESPNQLDSSSLIDAVGVEDVTAYIRQRGWKKIAYPRPELLVFQGDDDDDGKPIKLVLPAANEFVDARRSIRVAVNLLAAIDRVSPDDMAQAILNRGQDVFRQRLSGDGNVGSLPLPLAAAALTCMRDLVLQAANAEAEPSPFLAGGRRSPREYVEICRFGHTFAGSFGLSVQMPIPPNPSDGLFPKPEAPPFERRIMQRIMRGMTTAARAVRDGDVTILTKDYHEGFNANLCEVMARLMFALTNFRVEYSMRWSPEYGVSEELAKAEPVHVKPERFRPFFESAAKSLRSADRLEEGPISGTIVALRAVKGAARGGDQPFDGGQVTMRVTDGAEKKDYHIVLSAGDYRAACDAHRDGLPVTVTGRPEKLGRYWRVADAKGFHLAINK